MSLLAEQLDRISKSDFEIIDRNKDGVISRNELRMEQRDIRKFIENVKKELKSSNDSLAWLDVARVVHFIGNVQSK